MDAASGTPRNPETFWSFVRNSVDRHSIPLLKLSDGKLALGPAEKAKAFNEYFFGAQQRFPTHSNGHVGSADGEIQAEFDLRESVFGILSQRHPKTSSRLFSLAIKLLKIADWSLYVPLKLLFTKILKSRTFPGSWKRF